jgi:hypothetical protein
MMPGSTIPPTLSRIQVTKNRGSGKFSLGFQRCPIQFQAIRRYHLQWIHFRNFQLIFPNSGLF